jgi:hypothetical protein
VAFGPPPPPIEDEILRAFVSSCSILSRVLAVRSMWVMAVASAACVAGCGRSTGSGDKAAAAVRSLHGSPCGADGVDASDGIECAQYGSALEAFEDALAAGGAPLVLGVGEVHAPAGAAVASAAKRFTIELLPALAPRASDVLLELMMPPGGCASAVAEARREQEPVTAQHAATAQDEYVAMGERARALGVVPDMLRPTCADMDAIKHAGDDLVDVSLSTIARLARAQASRMIDRDALSDADRGKMVVLYGGSLHNDLTPPPEAARWSYAPALAEDAQGRFTAIDLIVPEFVGNDAAWQALAWWPRYQALRGASGSGSRLNRATLFRLSRGRPASFVLFFPVEAPPP